MSSRFEYEFKLSANDTKTIKRFFKKILLNGSYQIEAGNEKTSELLEKVEEELMKKK